MNTKNRSIVSSVEKLLEITGGVLLKKILKLRQLDDHTGGYVLFLLILSDF